MRVLVLRQANNGLGWGTAPIEADPDFGMWMDDLGENQSNVDQDDVRTKHSHTPKKDWIMTRLFCVILFFAPIGVLNIRRPKRNMFASST